MTMGAQAKAPQAMGSCLYECQVMHHRFSPKAHHFNYRIFMLAVDLDELPNISKGNALLSVNRGNLYSIREDDFMPTREPLHNGSAGVPASVRCAGLKDRVLEFVRMKGSEIHVGRVVLVTLPRVAGYLFNPVSFYFCYDKEGKPAAAIAEVTNTFREVKPYFLGPSAFAVESGRAAFHMKVCKHFYVSPYSDVDVSFDFILRPPEGAIAIQIDDYEGAERTLTSTVTGRRVPLSTGRLAWFSVKYPLVTLRVIFLIHLHALLLRIKGVPWFAKASRSREQRDLYRPHRSIETTPLT